MNFKRFHESKNLFDGNMESGTINVYGVPAVSISRIRTVGFIEVEAGTYTLNASTNHSLETYVFLYNTNNEFIERIPASWTTVPYTFTITNKRKVKFIFAFAPADSQTEITPDDVSNIMLNTGSTPLPYEPYSSEVWHDTPHYIHNTSTDMLTTLPAVLYPNGTTATVGLKGNMIQSSTPTPTAPIQPQECGDLETTGEHAGQYKIPILSASTTTPVYLGEVETTRNIAKAVITGSDLNAFTTSDGVSIMRTRIVDLLSANIRYNNYLCSHFENVAYADRGANKTWNLAGNYYNVHFALSASDYDTEAKFREFFNTNPVTIWYVLSEPTTGIVNEPIRKIGDYADTVSGITIPTTAGANTISVGTTLQPSEVSVNYKGWHPVSAVHERESGAWD